MRITDLLDRETRPRAPNLTVAADATVADVLNAWPSTGPAQRIVVDGDLLVGTVALSSLCDAARDECVRTLAQPSPVVVSAHAEFDPALVDRVVGIGSPQGPTLVPVVAGNASDGDILVGVIDAAAAVAGLREHLAERAARPYANFRRVVVPVDFDESSFAALRLVPETYPQAEVFVVHVIERTAGASPGARLGDSDDDSRRAAAGRVLSRAVGEAGLTVAKTVVRVGVPASEICAYASEAKADLIMIPSHARRGLRRWAMGSVAEAVMRQAPCPVLVLRRMDSMQQRLDKSASAAADASAAIHAAMAAVG